VQKKLIYKQNRTIIILLLLTIAALLPAQSFAFTPTAEYGHVGIVRDALKDIKRTSSKGNTLVFSERAIKEVRESTASVDEVTGDLVDHPASHCDDELLHDCTFRINSLKKAVIDNLKNDSNRNGSGARREVGRALHTLQDFYSHSNWIEISGGSAPNPDLGISLISSLSANQATCDSTQANLADFGLSSLTTGYFPIPGIDAPAGKCRHGLSKFDVDITNGIHKDDPSQTGHIAARQAAVEGTKKFIEEILDADGIKGNDLAIAEFMDSMGTLGFVIDDTGSMGTEIDGVKNIVANLVSAVQSDPDVSYTNFLFERFGDPDVGEPLVSKTPGDVLNAIFSLSPNGGGDCPELGQTALLNSLDKAEVRSQLYFFSDASSKDSNLANKVESLANDKKTTINYSLTGSCSPIDPAYIKVAQATGGQVFVINPNETGLLFNLIQPSLKGNLEPILILQDANFSAEKTYTLPVDSSITGITFSITSDVLSTAKVFRPSGAEVLPTDPGVTVTGLSTAKIVRIVAPETGPWGLSVSGAGQLSISVLGNSSISFNNFDFVEERGRSGHTGLFPILGKPIVSNTPSLATAFITGGISTAAFELRAKDNRLIQAIDLNKGTGEVATDEFFGSFTLPVEPFRVNVKGIDKTGKAYVRAYPKVFLAQTVRIVPETPLLELKPHSSTKINFTVTNYGAAGQFTISSSETIGLLTTIEPSTINLGANESAQVQLSLSIPDGISLDANQRGSLVVEVQSASNPDINNAAVVQLAVDNSIGAVHAVIDIKPGNSANQINLKSKGVIPVAILTTRLADGDAYDFDVSQIDLTSLTLSGAKTLIQGNSGNTGVFKDVDNDGDIDLLVQFYSNELDLDSYSTTAVLEGILLNGDSFSGTDKVHQVPVK
jgi:hypothetical protein